jgi:hypothetical protein
MQRPTFEASLIRCASPQISRADHDRQAGRFFKDARNDGGVEKSNRRAPLSNCAIVVPQPNTPGELRRRLCQQLARCFDLGSGDCHFAFRSLTPGPSPFSSTKITPKSSSAHLIDDRRRAVGRRLPAFFQGLYSGWLQTRSVDQRSDHDDESLAAASARTDVVDEAARQLLIRPAIYAWLPKDRPVRGFRSANAVPAR